MFRATSSLLVLAVLPAVALSQTAGDPPKKQGEWFGTIYVGQSETRDSSLLIRIPDQNTQLNFQNVKWGDESYKGPLYYGYKFTYWPVESILGFAFDFIHYKVFADTSRSTRVTGIRNNVPVNAVEPIGNSIQRFSISHGVNVFTFNAIFRPRPKGNDRYPAGRFFPYGGAGVGFVVNHPESEIGGDFFEQYQFGGYSWQLFLGAEYRLNPKYGLFVEYKFTDYHARVEIAQNGDGQAHLRTNHLAFGTTIKIK